jgi:succinate dehydrogenase / fumarate reductase, cytochrome b subunit
MGPRFVNTLTGYATYKGGKVFLAFLLHRVTGLGTLLFLTVHVTTTATVYFYSPWYSRLMEVFRLPLVMFTEIILVFCVIYHGANGLRIAYIDLYKPQMLAARQSNKAVLTTFIVAVLLWLPTAVVMGYNLLKYGLGLLGGE